MVGCTFSTLIPGHLTNGYYWILFIVLCLLNILTNSRGWVWLLAIAALIIVADKSGVIF